MTIFNFVADVKLLYIQHTFLVEVQNVNYFENSLHLNIQYLVAHVS